MFTTLVKKIKSAEFGENTYDRFYLGWDNAKEQMNEEVAEIIKKGGKVIRSWNEMNTDKGYFMYQKDILYEGDEITFALVESYFEDE